MQLTDPASLENYSHQTFGMYIEHILVKAADLAHEEIGDAQNSHY
jgi:hypothetical protein